MQDISFTRHLIDRLGFGPRPGDLDQIAAAGPERWISEQLHPATLAVPVELATRLGAFETLSLSPAETFLRYGPPALRGVRNDPDKRRMLQREARIVPNEAMEARILRAVYSPRQLEETLVDFWFNHFNVFVGKGLDRVWVGAYERDAIRPHVLGRFRDILGATAKHPAMLFYLDNWQNTAPGSPGARGNFQGLNENYAREVMELHTLGVDGGYTQADVIALARILTGWGLGGPGAGPGGPPRVPGQGKRVAVDPNAPRRIPGNDEELRRRGGFVFAEARHDFSDKVFLGQKIPGRGEHEGELALDILARHPATARHISYQLAQYYLADTPPASVTAAMAATFTKTDGDIAATLRTLFTSVEFRDPANFGTRFKTPLRYVVSAVRASGVEVRNFRPLYGTFAQLGQPLYGCQTPDGYKCTEAAWLNADAMTRRISFAIALAGGHLPLAQAPDPEPQQRGQKPGEAPGQPLGVRNPERAASRMAMPDVNGQPLTSPVDVATLIATLGGQVSEKTRSAVTTATPQLKAALVLGSPEFMRC